MDKRPHRHSLEKTRFRAHSRQKADGNCSASIASTAGYRITESLGPMNGSGIRAPPGPPYTFAHVPQEPAHIVPHVQQAGKACDDNVTIPKGAYPPEIAVDGLKNTENTNTLHGMYGIEILREIEYQHREGDRCSPAYLN